VTRGAEPEARPGSGDSPAEAREPTPHVAVVTGVVEAEAEQVISIPMSWPSRRFSTSVVSPRDGLEDLDADELDWVRARYEELVEHARLPRREGGMGTDVPEIDNSDGQAAGDTQRSKA
jgi:hypothetical protein